MPGSWPTPPGDRIPEIRSPSPWWHAAGVVANAGRLVGRRRERAVLERLLGTAGNGHGAILVVYGEPGVGKTALLEYAAAAGQDFRVVRTAGVEGEMKLDYAALQQLCAPLLEFVERLPDPQRDALGVAFGLSAGQAPSPFLVGLAVLGLLSEAAEQQPLLCVVDDAQWLDGASARALAFVARRLLAERIALAFATRELGSGLARFPQLHVEPLGRRDARALLESVLAARLDEAVLEQIIAETGGNPLALLELPRGLTPAQLAGGFGLPAALPLSSGIEQSFTRRLARLPRDARRLLLLAAAEPVGDPALLWRAARQLGIPETAAHAVESEGLLTLHGAVVFRHPLVRSAVYGAAEPSERREVHRALVDATDPQIDPDRRAWHRAQAASAPDDDLAGELERSAARAQARGGLAAAAAFLERAATLTREPSRRARRALAAAQTKFQAGALDDALSLLAMAEAGALSDLERARVALLRADSIRRHARKQCATAAAQGGATAGDARPDPCPRDISGRTVCGDVRGAIRWTRRKRAGGCPSRERGTTAARAPRVRPSARRSGHVVPRHLRVCRADPAAGAGRIQYRRVRDGAVALVMAGDHRVSPAVG
jgi:hypothetical protein